MLLEVDLALHKSSRMKSARHLLKGHPLDDFQHLVGQGRVSAQVQLERLHLQGVQGLQDDLHQELGDQHQVQVTGSNQLKSHNHQPHHPKNQKRTMHHWTVGIDFFHYLNKNTV